MNLNETAGYSNLILFPYRHRAWLQIRLTQGAPGFIDIIRVAPLDWHAIA